MSYEQQVEDAAKKYLVGRRITGVRYLSAKEADDDMGWDSRGVVIELEGGVELIPMQDDEGNGPGAIATNIGDEPALSIMAVLR